MIRHSKSPEYVRLALVRFAREQGIKPAARPFQMTVRPIPGRRSLAGLGLLGGQADR